MNQLWLGLIWIDSRDKILEQHNKKFWVTYLGWGEEEGSPMRCCFLFFACFGVYVF